MTVFKLRATSALTLFLLAFPAAGQNSRQPVIVTPPVGDFNLPPSGQTPAPPPTPAPSPTPTPLTIQPLPTATASPPAVARPAATRPAARAPDAAAAVPAPSASRTASATPAVVSEPAPAVESDLSTNIAAAPEPAGEAVPVWIWAALGGGLLLVLGVAAGWLLGRRRRAAAEEVEAVEPVSAPVAVPPPPPTPSPPARVQTPPAAAPAPPPEGMLVTELRPLRAAIRDGLVTLDFELFIQNRGTESADNIRAVMALMGANAQQDEHIAGFHASARMTTGSEPFSIAPGGVFMLNGQVSLPDGQMPAVNVQGKPMFVPIVPVALRWYAGLSIKTLRDAFMVGTVPAPGGDKLGPLWVERAASGFGPLAAKRYVPKPPG
ncbi:hypothetical protein M9978_10040 [Sphingomonas sp. MG17]|uniref:LPXTG-motif cell wall anchor domain-containing protein n=1 Tax=Sphingomonas tagetis TaxID=2949092 RepID=A0A9X2HKE4_9SPHN|nr:hypothetical protein [Sphingomonas tagetis]MCP3730769.1 hypothetical protein [Sphingomonas tagetis]